MSSMRHQNVVKSSGLKIDPWGTSVTTFLQCFQAFDVN